MDVNKLKLGLMYIFNESEKITKNAKLQLINFIKEADNHQLKVLVMDGELIPKQKLDEQARQIIDDRFENINEQDPITGLMAAAALITMITVMGAKRRATIIKKTRLGCSGKKGMELKVCMQQGTINAYKEEIGIYKSQMGKCAKTKNPEKCKASLTKHIQKAQNKIVKLTSKAKY
ncbi:hypothetical protein KAR91_38880 [Candidatus Pacearchaeota archaeon]|nr:hypothetical protein [Candidatus Pacearchaeota archaeon]